MSFLTRIFAVILVLGSLEVQGQSRKAPLSRVINVPSTIQIAPSLSGDGRHMIFTTSANLTGDLLLHYSSLSSSGKWSQPEPLTVINRSEKINHLGGYSLSYDGNYIFFTSRKTYGIGKYDIWYSEKMGHSWSAPKNLAKPVNSASNDGCPSISADGQYLYFVRCATMDQKDATGCVLMVSKKRNKSQWGEPEALPEQVNNGNILSPKILADGETLIYAKGEVGAMDLYQTQKTSKGWSKPVALDYVNSSQNERFVSVPGQGDVLYYSTMFQGTYDIIKAKIPSQFQPNKVVLLKGEVLDKSHQKPLEAFIQLYDLKGQELKQFHRTNENDGSFEFYIPGGRIYDFSVVALDQKHTFYSEQMDLRDLSISSRQKLKVELESLAPAVSFQLNGMEFDNDSTLNEQASFEMSRLFRMMKNNPQTQIEIAVHREEWEEDTLTLEQDTLYMEEALALQTSDSLTNTDSTLVEPPPPPPDPTEVKAETIVQYLLRKGVPEHLMVAKGYADSEPIAPNDTEQNRQLNRRIEIRIL